MEKRIVKLSGKGQAVIPVEFRNRLGLEPGMQVRFTIIGHVLQIERADKDIQEEIRFLQGWKGKLGESDFDDAQMVEIARDLLSQQFYAGTDLLTDRVGRNQIKIRGADSIIQETIKTLVNAGSHWLEGDYITSIREYCNLFNLDFGTVLANYNTKIRGLTMGNPDIVSMMGGPVLYAMAIGEILTQFRTSVGDETQERILREAEILGYNHKLGDETVEDKIISALADKFSILMNLRVLRELARISLKSIGQRQYEKFSDELLIEMESMKMPKDVKKRLLRRKRRNAKAKGIDLPKEEYMDDDDEDESHEPKEQKEITIPGMPSFDFGSSDS